MYIYIETVYLWEIPLLCLESQDYKWRNHRHSIKLLSDWITPLDLFHWAISFTVTHVVKSRNSGVLSILRIKLGSFHTCSLRSSYFHKTETSSGYWIYVKKTMFNACLLLRKQSGSKSKIFTHQIHSNRTLTIQFSFPFRYLHFYLDKKPCSLD